MTDRTALTPGQVADALVDASYIDSDQRQDVVTLLSRAAAHPPATVPDEGLRAHGGLVDRCRQHTAGAGADLLTLGYPNLTTDQYDGALGRLRGHINAIDDILTAALSAPPATVPDEGLRRKCRHSDPGENGQCIYCRAALSATEAQEP